VNGVSRGAAGQELSLPAVAQRLEVRKAGYVPFVTEVTPRPGLPQVVQARLLTPQQAVVAAVPKVVATKQGQEMRLIGPGEFTMGAPRREQGRRPNETERSVRITRGFYIGLREVTNREYREFRPNHTSGAEKYKELAGGDHPVVMLSWEDAASYCNWLSDRDGLAPAYVLRDGALRLAEPATPGYRLPTEAEWEWASRYNGGGGQRRYPWGDQMPPEPESGNYADQSAKGIVANVLSAYSDGFPVTAPVGRFKPSPLGLYDLGGNVAEWVNDRYTVYSGAQAEPAVDPQGPDSGQYHVIRGSSWRQASISELRFAYRDFGDQGRLDVGFRLARNAN
jgi:formylglycine-generating enzyme required for sulfatase activity